MAYTFFDNYHDTIKYFAQGDIKTYGRLMYILNMYAIEETVLDDLTPTETLFLSLISPSIDKSKSYRQRGKLGGRPKKDIDNTGLNGRLKPIANRLKPNSEKVKTEVEVEVEKEYEDEVEVEVTDPITTLYNPNNKNIWATDYVADFAKSNGFKFGAKTIDKLKSICATVSLEAQLNFVKSKYPDKTGDELAKLFVSSLNWEETKPAAKPKKVKGINYSTAPKKCGCGASVTAWGVPNSVRCVACGKEWELVGNEWQPN